MGDDSLKDKALGEPSERGAQAGLERGTLFMRRLAIMGEQEFTSIEKIYKIIRGMIEHEDNLINFRTSWFISLNSFLFGSISLVLTSTIWIRGETGQSPEPSLESFALGFLFSIVGLISCISTFISVGAAYNAIRALEKHWTYSFEPTVNGFSNGTKHHLDESKRVVSATGEKLAYDPEVVLPFVVGGGPFKKSVFRGKFSCFGVIWSVALLWASVLAYCAWRILTF